MVVAVVVLRRAVYVLPARLLFLRLLAFSTALGSWRARVAPISPRTRECGLGSRELSHAHAHTHTALTFRARNKHIPLFVSGLSFAMRL